MFLAYSHLPRVTAAAAMTESAVMVPHTVAVAIAPQIAMHLVSCTYGHNTPGACAEFSQQRCAVDIAVTEAPSSVA